MFRKKLVCMGLSTMCSFKYPPGTWNTAPLTCKMCHQKHMISNIMKTVDMQFFKL